MSTIPPGYADVSIELKHSGMTRSCYVTWGVRMDGVGASDVAQECLEAVMVPAGSLYSTIDSTVVIRGATARIGQDGGVALVYVAEGGATGGRSGTAPPPNVATLVHKRTSRGGRRGRGRMFLPFATSAVELEETGVVGAGAKLTVQNACNVFLSELTNKGVPMVILHNESEPGIDHPSVPGLPNLVTALTVDGLVSTQRRRLGR